ncbi:microtubule-associated protein futsch-like isoform X2 [Acipenser oxyrinchus oxyrinchus]|uniref:Microtubule-associated protein futsch-like isoform X2 n=1 Tax=Acipenser oxyrinchus oxyrinchus TaxID=40147 RepID=A0AAD8D8W0_ACIOX|nr:microtubule-associated protein futsch-like isoform X2 [Acipenser oxyrinchus oxyrinchus]
MPLHGKIVVIKRSGADGTEFPLTAQLCLFGRKPDCDIRIQLPHVSKEHCKIEVNENKEVIVTNLSTVNPTRLNGKIVHQSESLKDRDVITIIDRSFRFEYPPELTPKKRRLSASAKNETLQVLHVQQVKDTVCLSPGNQRQSTTLTSDASYDLKEAKAIGTELLSEAHIKNATPGKKDASDTEFAHNHRGNQEKLLEGLSPFSQLYKTLKRQFQTNDDYQAFSKDGKTPRKASRDAAPQTPLSRRKSDKINPTRAVEIQINEDKSKANHELPLEVKSTPKSAEEATSQILVSCVSSEEKNTLEDELNKEIIDLPRFRRRSKVVNDLQSDAVNGETSQISNMTDIIVTPKDDRRSASRGRSSIRIVMSADNEDDGFVEPSVSDNEASSVNGTPKSKGKGRPRKSPLKGDHAGGNSVCESAKEIPTLVENVMGTDQETHKRRRRSSQTPPVKLAEKEKESGEEAQHKQDSFSKAKETPKSKRNGRQFTLQRSISADEVLKEIQELPSSAEEMASEGKKTETPKKGRKSIESETPASEAELIPKKVSSSPRWRSRSLSPGSLETQDLVNGIITPQEEKKVVTPKTQESPVTNEVSPKQKTPSSSPRRNSGKAILKAEQVLSEIESLAPPSGENGAVETGTKKTSSKKRRSAELQEKLVETPLKRKRVSFAGHLSPELFDKRLPPDSPLRKGAMPTRLSLSVGSKGPSVLRRVSTIGIKYSLIKEFSEDNLSPLKPSPNKKASPKKTPSKLNTLSLDKKSQKLIAKTLSPAKSVAKTPSPDRKSLSGTAKTTSLGRKLPATASKMPSLAITITKTPPPGKNSPARPSARTPSPARPSARTPSPARPSARTPSPARPSARTPSPARPSARTPSPARPSARTPSPARPSARTPSPARPSARTPSSNRNTTKTPSPARSAAKTPSPARSITKTPSSNRKSLSSSSKTPSPAMSLAKTPSPGRKSLAGAAKTPYPSGAAKMPLPSRWSLAGAAEMPSPNKSVTKTPSTGKKSLGTSANTTPVVLTTTPKSGTPYVSGRFSVSHITTPSPIPEQSTAVSKAEPVAEEIHCDAVTPKPSHRRKSIQSAAKKTPSRRKSSILDAVHSRSGASKANLLVARSWADIVKLGAPKTQRMVFAKKQATKVKKVTIKKVTSKMPKTPAQKIKGHFSTGHADSPMTIVVGRAHARAVKPAGQVPKLVRNVALMKRSMEMNESFTGIAEMFSTPVNEKPRRTPRRASASTEFICSTPVSLTDASVLNTPEETGEMVVSPLSAPSTARRGRYNKDAVTRLLQEKESSYSIVKTPAKEIIAPIDLSGGSQVRVQPSEKVVDTSEQTLVEKTASETDEGCKKLMRTPKQKAEPLVALTGVKRLMKTPKQKSKQIEDFRGLKRLLRTPKKPKVQIIEDFVGVKRIMTTPKQKASPVEDMVGIKRLMRTPKHKGESVEDMSGISRTMKSPKLKMAPVEGFAVLQELMEQPEEKKQDHKSKLITETFEASETKRESKKHESVRTLAILAQSSIAAQQPPSRRSCRGDCEISVLPTPLNNCGRTEQVKLTVDIAEHSAVESSTDTPIESVKASTAQTASTRKSGRGSKASDVELSSLEAISVEVCQVKSDNISKPTTVHVKLSPTPKRATHGTENKVTSRSDTLAPPAFEIALVKESSIDSVKLSTPPRRSHGNEKDTVQNESSISSPPVNKTPRGNKRMQNVEQNYASTELTDLTVEIVKASAVSAKWTHSGQIKEVETPALPPETKQKIEEVDHMLNEVATAEESISQSVSSPTAKRSHGAIKDVTDLDTTALPAPMKKSLRDRKARHHSDETQETSTEVVADESVISLPMLKRSRRGAVKDFAEEVITSLPTPTKKSGRGRKAKQNSEDKHEASTKVVAEESCPESVMPKPKRSRQGAVKDIVRAEMTASLAPTKKSGRGRKARPNSDDTQETSAEVVVAEESSLESVMPFSTAKRSEQGAVKDTAELETTASPAPIRKSGRGRKAKSNSDDTQETSIKVVSAEESLPESVIRSPRTKRSQQGAVKDTAELETTASPAPTKKSGRGRKAKQNSKEKPEMFTKVAAAEESCPGSVMLSPTTKRLQQGAVKDTVGVETTASPAPTMKSGRGRKPKPSLDGTHETPVEAVAAESVMSSPSTKRSRRGAHRDTAEVETVPTKTSGRGRKAKQNTEDPYETSLVAVAVEKSCPESLMLSPTTKRSRQGVVNHAAEVTITASPADTKKFGRGRKTKQNSDDTLKSSAEVDATESELPSPTTKGARRGAIKDIAEKETTASLGLIKKSGRGRTAKQNSNDTQETSIEVTAAEKSCPESVMPSPTIKRSQRGTIKDTAEAETISAAPIKKSGRGRNVKHVEEIEHTSTEVPEESQAESVKISLLSKRSRRCTIEDTAMQKTRHGKKVSPVREKRGTTKKNAEDAETEELQTSKNSVIVDEIKNLSKKKVKWSTGLTMENNTSENNAVEHLSATEKRLQRGKARSEKGKTLDIEVPVQPAKPCRGRPGRKPKMTEAEMLQEQVADEPSSKEGSKQAVGVSSKREASLEIISNNVTAIEKEGLCGKSGSKRKMICKESDNANFEEQENVLIEVAPKRGRHGKAKTTVDKEAQSSTGPSASTVEIKAVPVVEAVKPRSIKRTGRAKASSQQKLDLPKETNEDHFIDESASQAEKPVKLKKPIGRGKRKLELEAETEADVSFLSPLKSTRRKRANLTNEAETRTLKTAADDNVTQEKVSRRRGAAAASDKKTAATKTEGKPVRSTRRR